MCSLVMISDRPLRVLKKYFSSNAKVSIPTISFQLAIFSRHVIHVSCATSHHRSYTSLHWYNLSDNRSKIYRIQQNLTCAYENFDVVICWFQIERKREISTFKYLSCEGNVIALKLTLEFKERQVYVSTIQIKPFLTSIVYHNCCRVYDMWLVGYLWNTALS